MEASTGRMTTTSVAKPFRGSVVETVRADHKCLVDLSPKRVAYLIEALGESRLFLKMTPGFWKLATGVEREIALKILPR